MIFGNIIYEIVLAIASQFVCDTLLGVGPSCTPSMASTGRRWSQPRTYFPMDRMTWSENWLVSVLLESSCVHIHNADSDWHTDTHTICSHCLRFT